MAVDTMVGYQDAINHRDTTIEPGGCAPASRKCSVDIITQPPCHYEFSLVNCPCGIRR
jgi:hypothetical protein